MRQEDIERLSSIGFFADLSAETMAILTSGALLQRYPAGTQIIEQGERPDFLNVLLDGSVEMVGIGADGRESIIEILRPVDCFILAAVLTDTPHLMTARVVEPARLLLLPAEPLREAIRRDNDLALQLLGTLAAQFRMSIRQIKNLKLRNATQRLGCYILALSDETGRRRFELSLDKRRLAARLGMTPESLSRSFAALRAFGVWVDGKHIEIDDPERLRADFLTDDLIDRVEAELRVPGGVARPLDRDQGVEEANPR